MSDSLSVVLLTALSLGNWAGQLVGLIEQIPQRVSRVMIMDRYKNKQADHNGKSQIESLDDTSVEVDAIIESLLLLLRSIADPIKLDIMKELATQIETGDGTVFYSHLNRKLKVSNRAIIKRLRELEGSAGNEKVGVAVLQSKWIQKETKTNPKVNVRVYEPIQQIKPGLKLLTEI